MHRSRKKKKEEKGYFHSFCNFYGNVLRSGPFARIPGRKSRCCCERAPDKESRYMTEGFPQQRGSKKLGQNNECIS